MENKCNFKNITPNDFEINNPNISYTISEEKNNIIYSSRNNSTNKKQIVKLKNNGDAAIKPLQNKFFKLDKLVEPFSHIELGEHILQSILKFKIDEIKMKKMDN